MRRLTTPALACAVIVGAAMVVAQPASASGRHHFGVTTAAHGAMVGPTATATKVGSVVGLPMSGRSARKKFSMNSRFARQKTVMGQSDRSPTKIEHVVELQARLRWAGVYNGRRTAYFGPQTKTAVKRFQKRAHLKVTGKATHATWAKLIKSTIRRRGSIPAICKTSGWHACYDRSRNQVTLWKSGTLWNSWLVRGGASNFKTRTGNYTVYLRSRHHVSSLYDTPMPYAQFFSGGQAFHASYFMTRPWAGHSHGCVNMYVKDARQLWNLTAGSRLRASIYGAWA